MNKNNLPENENSSKTNSIIVINQSGLDLINSIEIIQKEVFKIKNELIILQPTLLSEKDIRIKIYSRFNNLLISTKLSLIFIETNLKDPHWWNSAYSGEIAHPFRKHAAQFREKILVGIIVH